MILIGRGLDFAEILRSMKERNGQNLNQKEAVQLSGCDKASRGPRKRKKRKTEGADRSERSGRKESPKQPNEQAPEEAGRSGWGRYLNKLTISGGNDEGVPPVPIPNTEVKPFSADGT